MYWSDFLGVDLTSELLIWLRLDVEAPPSDAVCITTSTQLAVATLRLQFVWLQDDLANIAQVFADVYGQPLVDFINADCSGEYRRLLVAIIGNLE